MGNEFTGFKMHIKNIIGPSTPFWGAIANNGGKMVQNGRYTVFKDILLQK